MSRLDFVEKVQNKHENKL